VTVIVVFGGIKGHTVCEVLQLQHHVVSSGWCQRFCVYAAVVLNLKIWQTLSYRDIQQATQVWHSMAPACPSLRNVLRGVLRTLRDDNWQWKQVLALVYLAPSVDCSDACIMMQLADRCHHTVCSECLVACITDCSSAQAVLSDAALLEACDDEDVSVLHSWWLLAVTKLTGPLAWCILL
jgi:hypothetical protein